MKPIYDCKMREDIDEKAEGVYGGNVLCFAWFLKGAHRIKMTEHEKWRPFIWHCVNCGCLVTGFENQEGKIKVECENCKTVMVRVLKNTHRDILDIYAPKGQVRI